MCGSPATGGDALYSVSEIALYAEVPDHLAAVGAHTNPRGCGGRHRSSPRWSSFGIFAAFFLLVHRRKAGRIHYI